MQLDGLVPIHKEIVIDQKGVFEKAFHTTQFQVTKDRAEKQEIEQLMNEATAISNDRRN